MEDNETLFSKLHKIDVSAHIEKKETGKKKDGKKEELSYLSWTYAIEEFENAVNGNYEYEKPYHEYDEHLGYMVHTAITVDGKRKEMWLPVMNGANKAMKDHPYKYKVRDWSKKEETYIEKEVEPATMMDINKAYMRCLVKNMAMFGLGLYIYAGEDLPPSIDNDDDGKEQTPAQSQNNEPQASNDGYDPNADDGTPATDRQIGVLKRQDAMVQAKIIQHYKVEHITKMTKAMASDAIGKLYEQK